MATLPIINFIALINESDKSCPVGSIRFWISTVPIPKGYIICSTANIEKVNKMIEMPNTDLKRALYDD